MMRMRKCSRMQASLLLGLLLLVPAAALGVDDRAAAGQLNGSLSGRNRSRGWLFPSSGTPLSFGIDLEARDLAELDADPKAEQYVPCNVTVDFGSKKHARTFVGAGCRYKGAIGSFAGCTDPGTGARAEPSPACRKLSWKIHASKFANSTELNKMKKTIEGERVLLFHGMQHDMSLMAERMSYTIMQDLGIQAPRVSAAVLHINGRFDGIYNTVEQIDRKFTRRVFGNDTAGGGGALYKEVWPRHEDPAAVRAKEIVPGPNNTDAAAIFVSLRHQAQTCLALGPALCNPGLAALILNNFTQPDSFIDGLVAATILSNWDQPFTFFCYGHEPYPCEGGMISNHNFYIYTEDLKLSLVQWDYTDALLSVCGFNHDLLPKPYDPALCYMPPWYDELSTAQEQELCHKGLRAPGKPSSTAKAHFTCDPVAKLMVRAWRGQIFERMRAIIGDGIEPATAPPAVFPGGSILRRYNELADDWRSEYERHVTKDADLNEGFPRPEQWREAMSQIAEAFAGNLGALRVVLRLQPLAERKWGSRGPSSSGSSGGRLVPGSKAGDADDTTIRNKGTIGAMNGNDAVADA